MAARAPQLPPGPRGIAALRTLERLRVDLLDELGRLQSTWGDTVLVSGAGQRMVILYDPRDVEAVFVGGATNVRKGFAFRRSRRLLGNGLITSDGDFHLRQRRMLQPCLQPRRLAPYADVMVEEANRTVDAWGDLEGDPVDIERAMGRLGLAVVGRTMFGVDLSPDASGVYDSIEVARSQFVGSLTPLSPVLQRLPLPSSIRFSRARRTLRGVVESAIAAREDAAADPDAPDLLSLLLAARDDEGRPMPHRQVVDEALTNLLAGHDTIANTLTWALSLLAQHPDIQERLAREVSAACGPDRRPGIDDLDALPLTRAVFLETLRLYPQCYSMTRTALAPIELARGMRLQRGWEVLVPQWSIHRDERWWPDAERFDPDRFVDAPGCPRSAAASSPQLPRLAFFPFGAGRRICIGQAYSMMEGVLVLSRIVQRVSVTTDADCAPAGLHAMFTLWPGPVHLRVTKRSATMSVADTGCRPTT